MENKHSHYSGSPGQNAAQPVFTLKRLPSGHFHLEIRGRFPPNWVGNLFSGLFRNHINVIRGSAKKMKTIWHAGFEIMTTPLASDPGRIDYLALAMENPISASATTTISLDAFVLDDDPTRHDDALYLEIRAGDQLGFLGALLGRFAYYTLFPEAMIIETENGRIYDRFWIKGVGGRTPSPTSVNALKKKLDSFLLKG